jgi:hypothetical protein
VGDETWSPEQVRAWFNQAMAAGRAGRARNGLPIDARPAVPGEIVVTTILGEGVETQNRAQPGDWVVRNHTPETGNEEYIVRAETFRKIYESAGAPPDTEGWCEFHPVGEAVRFVLVRQEDGPFSFVAPWGELMVARPGDAIVQNPHDERDIYRVARTAFDSTYQLVD